MALALTARVSTRHLSYLETGRAQPSREMVLQLADAMQLPLRERNTLLLTAGFAPHFAQTPLDAAPMSEVRSLLELLLRRNEPFGAVVLDRQWNVVMVNTAYAAMLEVMLRRKVPAYTVLPEGQRPNLLKAFFEPQGLRPFITNWSEVARELVPRLQRERVNAEDSVAALLDSVLNRRDLPTFDAPEVPRMIVPLELSFAGTALRFFTTISSIGTPHDVTLEELRTECLHPADEATAQAVHALRGG